jgi:hypothetical protein
MSVAEEKPAVDAILLKVMEAVPFQSTTDRGVQARGSGRRPAGANVGS